jgi:RNA recognition motif-containing protein
VEVKNEPPEEDLNQAHQAEVKTENEEAKKPFIGIDGRPRRDNIGTVVHITDMSWYTTDIEVEAACSVFGKVINVKFFEDRSNGRSMGACAVEFNTMEEAKACIAGLGGKTIGSDTVQVDWPGKRPPFKQRCVPH